MKGTFILSLVIIFSMLVIPLSSLSVAETPATQVAVPQDDVSYQKDDSVESPEKIKVLNGDKIEEYSIKDYIFGVVAAEMPALYHEEALKAQAVAAYTFVCYRMQSNTNSDYDISADPEVAQCFITREDAASRWGDNAQEYTQKIDKCISEVAGQILTYDNQPIFAAYHAISPGKTNPCSDVWSKDLPYLKSVDSSGDLFAEKYLSEAQFTADEISDKLKDIATASGEVKNYFSDIKTTDTGLVKSISYCGKKITGAEICKALNLRSSHFEVTFAENKFTFTVKGYGHGVGMSQNGADYLAKQGKTYKEILLHYYNGATLQKNKNNT